MYTFPMKTIKRIAKEDGNVERMNKDATIKMNNIVANYCKSLAEYSYVYAKHAGRKTITVDDVKLALKELR